MTRQWWKVEARKRYFAESALWTRLIKRKARLARKQAKTQ